MKNDTIFYSWQSDLPNPTNRSFIQTALEKSAKGIKQDKSISVHPVIDRDTSNVPGSPDIAATIFDKIDNCSIFACDVSIINSESEYRKTPNPNVLIELGYALKRIGWNRILMILNTEYGPVEDLPFDLRMKRVTTYNSKKSDKDRATERNLLQNKLTSAIKSILVSFDEASEQPANNIVTDDDNLWKENMRIKAIKGLTDSGFKTYVEAFSTISNPRPIANQIQLLDAVQHSQIDTFGWPIAVMGRNTEHMRPQPLKDGIFNSVLASDNKSYDFWAIRSDGSFYLLKSLMEDMKSKNEIYFNTRILRTCEMLLFLSNLHNYLKTNPEAKIHFKLKHAGLSGRVLSATSNRSLFRTHGPVVEDEIETEIESDLTSLQNNTSILVQKLLSSVFSLFDFFELNQEIYDDLINKFKKGVLS